MLKIYDVKLTLDELLIIDGKVSKTVQKTIDTAKRESSFGFELPVMNEILRHSEQIGKLTWTYKSIRSCNYCDKKHDYHRYPRSGRHHRKGDKNFDKPINYNGIKFNEGFVTIQGYGDMCTECCTKYNVINRLIDHIIDNDLKIQIKKNDYREGKYLKDEIRICHSCNHEMQESTMGRQNTLMGNGTYPSYCPRCGEGSNAFGNSHKVTNKFVMIENPAAREEIQQIKNEVKLFNEGKVSDDQLSFIEGEGIFAVKERKWTNGNMLVVRINTTKNTYEVGSFYKDKHEFLTKHLASKGYQQLEYRFGN